VDRGDRLTFFDLDWGENGKAVVFFPELVDNHGHLLLFLVINYLISLAWLQRTLSCWATHTSADEDVFTLSASVEEGYTCLTLRLILESLK
jgi:hypothetical protein